MNPGGAQLLFTSHNTTILKKGKLRRDQLYVINKDDKGESKLSRFHQKGKSLRTDTSLEKEFLEGDLQSHPDIQIGLFTGLLDFPST